MAGNNPLVLSPLCIGEMTRDSKRGGEKKKEKWSEKGGEWQYSFFVLAHVLP